MRARRADPPPLLSSYLSIGTFRDARTMIAINRVQIAGHTMLSKFHELGREIAVSRAGWRRGVGMAVRRAAAGVLCGVMFGVSVVGLAAGCSKDGAVAEGAPRDRHFTTDDGKTYFTDTSGKLAPFPHDGKEAVQAHLAKCGEKVIVLYLSRYSTAAKRAIDGGGVVPLVSVPKGQKDAASEAEVGIAGQEFKRPGDTKWISGPRSAVEEIRNSKCPDGGTPKPYVE